ncbi:hypothetical protein NPIL_625871, partial [Nephila pilipes]
MDFGVCLPLRPEHLKSSLNVNLDSHPPLPTNPVFELSPCLLIPTVSFGGVRKRGGGRKDWTLRALAGT